VFEGYRVVELGTWLMVPAATAVLADFGADVIKIEQPGAGDPVRRSTLASQGGANLLLEGVNRGKRSIALDLGRPGGTDILYRMASVSDVFITNMLPAPRRRLKVDVDDIRRHNPHIVYVRGSGVGARGPEADKQGFDFGVFWARAGFQSAVSKGSALDRPVLPRPGFGDRTSAMNLAFGIAAALLRRERTGQTAVVDVSLLGSGMWADASDIAYSMGAGRDVSAEPIRRQPLGGLYCTADGRWIQFNINDPDRWWEEFCRTVGRADLAHDPRFAEPTARTAHASEAVAEFDKAFAGATLAEWRRRLAPLRAAWEPVQDPFEVSGDPQVAANGYVAEVAHPGGGTVRLIRAPIEFDATPPEVGRAPGVGEHTAEILTELGYDAAEVARWREAGVVAGGVEVS
jgi:crotonobetainyl-CoA:carnitine CoA-transferase CaiB-like acyl-CoA transferase